ncbi:MAG: hypothetical protein ACR2NR_22265 [Solirubrobacteraceae bacterium]
MSLDTSRPNSPIADRGPTTKPSARVLVIFELNSNGAAALTQAAEVTSGSRSGLTVVTVAPQQPCTRCCGPSAEPFNAAVREDAERDLRAARELVGPAADRAAFKVLVGGRDPPLPAWIAEQAFDLVLLPRHRFTLGGHPMARKLRRATRAQVRLVGSSAPVDARSGS